MERRGNNENLRSTIAQLLLALALSTLRFNMGLVTGMHTVVIGALRTDDPTLRFTEEEASWFGSMAFIIQPVGSVISGVLQDVYGRKLCLAVVGVPLGVAWYLLYSATSIAYLFVANFILAFSIGLTEAPIHSFVGEISQPRFRGIFSSLPIICYNMGVMTELLLGTFLPWRYIALVSMLSPILATTVMMMVPESPAWLVGQGRIRDAEKSFQWFRGWVRPEDIKDELDALVSYVKETQTAEHDDNPKRGGEMSPNSISSWRSLLEPDVLVIFRMFVIYFISSTCVSLTAFRPFLIEILGEIQIPIRSEILVAICGGCKMLGVLSLMVGIKLTGRRQLTFLSVGISILVCLGLAAYLWTGVTLPWVPVILFSLCYYCGTLGVLTIPWILLGELFPLRARGLASGISGAFGYFTYFLAIKMYHSMVALMGIAGVCCVNGVAGVLGIIYLYWDLPETDGLTLEDIERILSERRTERSGVQLKTKDDACTRF